MLTLKKVKEMVKAPVHTKRVPSPKVLLEEGRIFLRKEFEHGSHLTLYHNGYVWFSAGKRNTVFHIHDCRGDYAYGASKGKGEVIKEEYFENCEWHIRALFEGEQRVEESQLKCEGVGQTKVSVSYHAVAEDWGEMADSEINVLDKYIEKEALHAMMAVLTKKQRNLIYQNYVLDKTHQEIADGMGIARGSVNQALERIRRKFDFEAHYELAVALPSLQWRFRSGQADGSFYELWPGLQKCLAQFSPIRPDGGAGRRNCTESSDLLQREEREEVSARRRIWLCPVGQPEGHRTFY